MSGSIESKHAAHVSIVVDIRINCCVRLLHLVPILRYISTRIHGAIFQAAAIFQYYSNNCKFEKPTESYVWSLQKS